MTDLLDKLKDEEIAAAYERMERLETDLRNCRKLLNRYDVIIAILIAAGILTNNQIEFARKLIEEGA